MTWAGKCQLRLGTLTHAASQALLAAQGAPRAPAGGLLPQVEQIRAALNIATPTAQLLNVVNEANLLLWRPPFSAARGGTLPNEVAELLAALGL